MAHIIEDVVRWAPDDAAAQRVHGACRRHGAPFAAYLTLDGVDPYDTEVSDGFEASYLGSFPDRAALVTQTIETFGWQHDLDRVLGTHLELSALVAFDPDAVFGFVCDHYDVVETDTGLYLFEAWQRPAGN